MTSGAKQVSVERFIAAPPEQVFAVLADPSQHAVIDGSGTVKRARRHPERLALGSKFSMGMRIGLPYVVTNTVVEFEENRRIAWRHFARHVWRYELFPADGGTRVVETFDWSPNPFGFLLAAMGVPERNRRGMEQTLERLAELVAA